MKFVVFLTDLCEHLPECHEILKNNVLITRRVLGMLHFFLRIQKRLRIELGVAK